MFAIIYSKSTKEIVSVKFDASTITPPTPQQQRDLFCEMNDLNPADYEGVEATYNKKVNVVPGKYRFNETTGEAEENPNYVEPTPVTPTEPTV